MKAMTHTEFKAWRAKRKMTQRQAAVYLSLSIATIRAYEANPRRAEKWRKVPRYMQRYIEGLQAIDMLAAAPASLRKQVAQAYREHQKAA